VGRVHTARWIRKLEEDDLTMAERMTLEVPWSASLARASWLCAGGSILAGRMALASGVAVHLGGGFHHAFADRGEGFCAIHDVAVAIRALLAEGAVERAIVIDLDVHHGNGTAAIFAGDPAVFTLSFHQEQNYPFPKPPGDLDVGFADGAGDAEYLARIEEHLPAALDGHRPQLAFYLAGADPYDEDVLGGLRLTREGLRERDRRVLAALSARDISGAVCLAGGYALRREDTVAIHAGTVKAALEAIGSM
ncbi:MAG: histone deacetylase, partial [Gemmatimonadota bacterium]|nr:histone deacetylase [Gemmatimonadota bacterium]